MAGWTLQRGATLLDDGSTRFSVWAPRARKVSTVIEREDAEVDHTLERRANGIFEAVVPDVAAGTRYRFRIDDEPRGLPDPVSRFQPEGVHGPSVVIDHRAYPWHDDDWRGLEMSDWVLYELHVGAFTPAGTFDAAIERIPYLKDLGVTAIELMPVAQFPGRRNWGYDGVQPYAPQNSYGGPEGLRRLVDAAHQNGMGVVLDVVYNHLGPEGNYLARFGPYFTDRYGTPWGEAVNFDGPESDEVRRYFIDNALYWITEFHIDGLRLDAIHAIFDFSAIHILEELAAAVHGQARILGRRAQVIAESDLNDPRIVRPIERGGYNLDGAWNDDFHHAVHAALTRERQGYYIDFGGVEPVARALRDRFVLDGRYSAFRGRRHGAPANDVPGDRLVAFIQNHDQVGNRAQGERLGELVSFEARKLATALLLLSPYVPLLFMGEEYGESHPFLYFVDHGDPDLVEAVRRGRRAEFARFDWAGPVPDPAAEETFERSRLDWEEAERPPHSQLLSLYRDLIALRRAEPALRPGAGWPIVHSEPEAGWITAFTETDGAGGLAAFNLSGSPAAVELNAPPGTGQRRLATDEPRYGGEEATTAPARLTRATDEPIRFTLAGQTAAFYTWEGTE